MSTGRKCDGYPGLARTARSWDYLLGLRNCSKALTTGKADASEGRGLAFFSDVVATTLDGPFGQSSWCTTLLSASQTEPAVRDAMVAVSTLYEVFGMQEHGQAPDLFSNEVATRHYNSAIQHMVSNAPNPDVILLVCLLFICIEFIRNDPVVAITHVSHGASLLELSTLRSDLGSVFDHLSIFPHFFGQQPSVIETFHGEVEDLAGQFPTMFEARQKLDGLLRRAVCLVQRANQLRLSTEVDPQAFKLTILARQCTEKDLHTWGQRFSGILAGAGPGHKFQARLLEIQWLVATIWTNTCSEKDEMVYDAHKSGFERILRLATSAKNARDMSKTRNDAKFSFSMGFCPLLHFVVLKCRFLSLRLRALELMASLSLQREAMWDRTMTLAIATRIIEVEHGLDLSVGSSITFKALQDEDSLPRDEQRIRDNMLESETYVHHGQHGKTIRKQKIRLLVKDNAGGAKCINDWITLC